jgi:molybdopterin-dependent oxidoreductase alpha subunit
MAHHARSRKRIAPRKDGGGWPAILYTLRKARRVGLLKMWRALRSRNACKTCALGMGGQLGGMTNEKGRFPEVCKKSVQAMAADLQGAIHPHFFDDFSLQQLRAFTSRELEAAGRLTQPLYAGPLDSHYRPISWDMAIERIVARLKRTDPREAFFYFSGRSSNEAGFLLQLFARLWGTNNVNNCSYYCHQASGVGLSSVTGSGTATITLEDLDHADLIFLIGANPASNHPRFMRTLVDLKRRGGKVIVINPLKEVGLVRFRVPSDVRSLLFGSDIADEYVQPHIGGDIALLSGIAKTLIEMDGAALPLPRATEPALRPEGREGEGRGEGAIDRDFLRNHVDDWPAVREHLHRLDWETITHRSGVSRDTIAHIAQIYAQSKNTIFCWAMGITHHEHGVRNVQAIANLALMRGMLGRPGAGLLPLRGHSNVQGIGSMGVTPKLRDAIFDKLQSEFGVQLPTWPGMDTLACVHAAHQSKVRFAWCLGGNLFGSNPDANFAHEALSRIDQVVYLSTTLNTGHAWGRGKETIILPVLARDEETQATTQESMFNYVRMSDGAPPHAQPRHAGPRSEIDIIAAIAHAVLGDSEGQPLQWHTLRDHASIRRMIAKIIPGYEAVGAIDQTRQEFTIPGRVFHEPHFPTDTGRAKMHVVELPPLIGEAEVSDQRSEVSRASVLRLMTMRSEGQFNTVVYEDEDVYRAQERRDVVLMNERDMQRRGLDEDDRVNVCSAAGEMRGVLARAFDLPQGNCAMYYPEANVLIPRIADPLSRTPVFKSVAVRIERSAVSDQPSANGEVVAKPQAAGRPRELKAC